MGEDTITTPLMSKFDKTEKPLLTTSHERELKLFFEYKKCGKAMAKPISLYI